MHCFGDALWKHGSKDDPSPLPPPQQASIEEAKAEAAAEPEVDVIMSSSEVDEAMRRAFVLTLRELKKSELPLLFSAFGARMTTDASFNVKQVCDFFKFVLFF